MTSEPASVIRPASHIAAVRADAVRAAVTAARNGREPDYFVRDAIDWATGTPSPAPFTGRATTAATPSDLVAEAAACETYLKSSSYDDENAQQIDDANDVLELLHWLTGQTDRPPVYSSGTAPGDLVGGHGVIVRDQETITAMSAAASSIPGQRGAAALVTLAWLIGTGPAPMDHPDADPRLCTHPASLGEGPDERAIIREQHAAEEHTEPGGYRHGNHPAAYAASVTDTIRWALGSPERPLP